MKRVLLTGGTGFVGANLTRHLLKEGHEVHLLVRPGYAPWRIQAIQPDVRLYEMDMADVDTLQARIDQIRPEWVFHLAAYGAYSSQTNFPQMIQTNFVNTVNLVEVCLQTGFEAFVNTGSSSEYGFKSHMPSEEEKIDPNSHYAVTKASATQYCRFIAQSRRVRITTLRLYSVYGPFEEPTRLIPTLIMYGLEGRLPPLVDPNIARDYVFIEDVNEAYMLSVTESYSEMGAVFNVGTGIQTRLLQAVEEMKAALNIHEEPKWGSMPNRQWDTTVWGADIHAIQSALGWQPRQSFREGLRQTIDWLRKHAEMREFYRKSFNRDK